MYRQGDLLIVKVDRVPDGARPAADCVLALGEATGHTHRIESGATQYLAPDGSQYVVVTEPLVALVHEEHRPVGLAGPAVYRVIRQREYVPPEPGPVAPRFFRVVGD